VSFACEAFS